MNNWQESQAMLRTYEGALESALSLLSDERDSLLQDNQKVKDWVL